MTLDVAEFCRRFAVPPEHVVATEHGLRVIGLPNAEADRVIVSMMAAGLIDWFEDDTLDDDEDDETCRYCGARGEREAICHSPSRADRCWHNSRDDRGLDREGNRP